MKLAFLIPLVLGVISVAQGGLNRRIASQTSLQLATLTNCIVLLGAALVFYFWNSSSNSFGFIEALKNRGPLLLIPGILGFFLVVGIPFAMGRWGASFVFVWIIGSQMTAGLLWDFFLESRPIHPVQIAGAALSILGALCFSIY